MRTKTKILISLVMFIVTGSMMSYPQEGNVTSLLPGDAVLSFEARKSQGYITFPDDFKALNGESSGLSADGNLKATVEETDSSVCLPLGIDLALREYQDNTSDTVNLCVYDTVSIVSGYTGPLELLYKWSNGSSDHGIKSFTTGVGNDIQKIWVEVTDPQTGCVYSDTLTLIYQFGSCVGIETPLTAISARIFPNPAHDIVTVEYKSDAGPVQLLVMDVRGQVVYQDSFGNKGEGIQQIRLDLHFLPRGLYLVELIGGKELYTGKILLD